MEKRARRRTKRRRTGPQRGWMVLPSHAAWARTKAETFTSRSRAVVRLPGVPRIQRPQAYRITPINSQLEYPPDLTPAHMGDSVARWTVAGNSDEAARAPRLAKP
jgi:hypothetical protein